jgi:hypothetical protein
MKQFRRSMSLTCVACAAELERRIAYYEAANAKLIAEHEQRFVAMRTRRALGQGPTAAEAKRDLFDG